MIRPFLAGVVALLALCGCQAPNLPAVSVPAVTAGTTVTAVPGALADSCHLRAEAGQSLPDPVCTPGASNPTVTQASIGSTICKRGWTTTIRPPVSYTDRLKWQQEVAYGETGALIEDHLVPLEAGGSPTSPSNLWPEPSASSHVKDRVEDATQRAICSGRMTLAAAQQQIATDWVKLGRSLGVLH
jgi:hypothetical protein